MPDPLAWERRFRAACSSRASSETGCWGSNTAAPNASLPSVQPAACRRAPISSTGSAKVSSTAEAEPRVTQPRQQRGGPCQAAEIVGGLDQRQIPALNAVHGGSGAFGAFGTFSSFSQHDHHLPAEPLGEQAIALRQRQERGTRKQARELVRHGRRSRGGQQAMPLDGVPDGSRQRRAVHLFLEQEILRAIADHMFGQGSRGRFHQEDDGNMRGRRLDPAECFGALAIPKIRVEQQDIHGLGRQDGRGIGPSGRMGRFQMNPVTPAARAVQLGQDFAQEQGVFGCGFGQQNAQGHAKNSGPRGPAVSKNYRLRKLPTGTLSASGRAWCGRCQAGVRPRTGLPWCIRARSQWRGVRAPAAEPRPEHSALPRARRGRRLPSHRFLSENHRRHRTI